MVVSLQVYELKGEIAHFCTFSTLLGRLAKSVSLYSKNYGTIRKAFQFSLKICTNTHMVLLKISELFPVKVGRGGFARYVCARYGQRSCPIRVFDALFCVHARPPGACRI